MSNRGAFLVMAGLALCVNGTPLSGQEPAGPPAYANVEVISVDPVTRIVVVKDSKGAQEHFAFDDGFAGASGLKTGDHVMMTVRGEPGRKRISAITKLMASPVPAGVSASPPPALRPSSADLARLEMRERFSNQVATLSQQARSVDGVWSSFLTACDVKEASSADGARGWFGLWDGRVKADLSSGFCRDLFNQIISSGEGIKKAMGAAEDVARKTLDAEEVRDIRRLNSMDWGGWALPAPEKLEL